MRLFLLSERAFCLGDPQFGADAVRGRSGRACAQKAGASAQNRGKRLPDMMPHGDDTAPGRARDLAAQARRAWMLFGSRSRRGRDGRRDDDDDDDLPRPNAIVALFPLLSLVASPLPA
ncbi:hypothetical protein WMF20_03835 [Sorangium sp. So ce834]|uniref:hypothetical protein n=1 Tax=Sorangium sp. So ce834 TaxID=3133321 RepID=UPI003F5EB86B